WANSAALHAAGIERATLDPEGGLIGRDARGEPTGLLLDTAQRLLHGVEPRPSDEQFDRAVRECLDDCLAAGLAGIHEMGAELYGLTLEAGARGFQRCVHAIGDRANTLVLDAFERALARAPRPDHRLRVEHAQILTERDVPRFAALGVLPSMQATHCTSDMAWAAERLGPERLRGAYAWRSLLATGVIIAGGSDFPVESPNPFHGIHAAVTRRPRTNDDQGWQPEQRMTREEAVRSFTTWNAFASRQERDLGSL